jgi:hypothetical protein
MALALKQMLVTVVFAVSPHLEKSIPEARFIVHADLNRGLLLPDE